MAESSNLVTVQSIYHHKLLTDGLWNFFTAKYKVDLQVITPNGEMVNAHQLILDVFLPPEKLNCEALVDQRSNLQTLLQFIYTGVVQVEAEELENMLWLGKELDFQMLVDAVEATIAGPPIAETETEAGDCDIGGDGDPALDPAVVSASVASAKTRRKGNPVKRTSRDKGNPIKLTVDSDQKKSPLKMQVEVELPGDSFNTDKVNSSTNKRIRSVMLLVPQTNSLPDEDIDSAHPELKHEDNCFDEDHHEHVEFEPEEEDEEWYPGDETPEAQFRKFVKHGAATKASRAKTVKRIRRGAVANKNRTAGETEGGDGIIPEDGEESGTSSVAYGKQPLNYRRAYDRSHPVITCKLKPCTFRSRSKNSHQIHMATVHSSGAELFPCPTCAKPFLDVAMMKRHHHIVHSKASGEVHSVEFFQCPHCDYKTRSDALYELHLSRRHGESNAEIYRCDMCARAFLRSDACERHKLSHKPYKCAHCDFETTKTWNYTNHLFSAHRLNLKGEPVEKLKCPECDYLAKDQCVLRYHTASQHTLEKPYKCLFPQCQHRFVRKCDREKHNKIAHLKLRNYMCEFCSFRAITPYSLEIHRRSHTGERPFHCDTCSKTFVDRYQMKKHTKLHTSTEKPFLCHLCTFACNRRDNLRTHIKGVHKNQIDIVDINAVS